MIRKKIAVTMLILLVSVLLIGCNADDSEVESTNIVIPVKLGVVVKDTVEETYVTIGKVIPSNQLDVYLNSIGKIETIFIKPGDFIEKDMPMIQLINDATNTTFNSTESQLRTIRDNLAVQYNAALENYNLQKVLFDTATVSQNTLDASHDQLLITQRQYRDAQITYNNQISNLQSSVDDLLVKSPIDGQIASLNVKIGETARNQLAATIIDNSTLYVQTMVSGELKKSLSLDQDVKLSLEGIDQMIHGKVSVINEIPDMNNKLFEVRIIIIEDVNIGVGDFSEVEFITKSYETNLVPSTAIVRKGIEKYVFTYDDEILKKVVLETGLSNGEWIEAISDELNESSIIVIRGQNDLRVDDVIQIIED